MRENFDTLPILSALADLACKMFEELVEYFWIPGYGLTMVVEENDTFYKIDDGKLCSPETILSAFQDTDIKCKCEILDIFPRSPGHYIPAQEAQTSCVVPENYCASDENVNKEWVSGSWIIIFKRLTYSFNKYYYFADWGQVREGVQALSHRTQA